MSPQAAQRLALAVGLALATAGAARADPSSDEWLERRRKYNFPIDVELAVVSGYGTEHFNYGLGGRAGVSVYGVYVGGSVVELFGGNLATNGSDDSVHYLVWMGEVGYGLRLGPVTVRPLFGVGDAVESFPPSQSPSTTSDALCLFPGGLVQVTIGHVFFGVDARAVIPILGGTDLTTTAFTVLGQVGATFDVSRSQLLEE